MMFRKKLFCVAELLIGVGLISAALLFGMFPEMPKSVGGICIGVGAGLFGMSLSNLYTIRLEKKHPEIRNRKEIECSDERNVMILSRAKAKAGDIIQWFIMGIAYVTILIGTSLWVTLAVIGVFLLKYVLEVYFTGRYQKEM